MGNCIDILIHKSKTRQDLVIESVQIGSLSFRMAGYESIVNWQETLTAISLCAVPSEAGFEEISRQLLGNPWTEASMNELLQGKVVLVQADTNLAFSVQGKLRSLIRPIESAQNEPMLFTPAIAFTELLGTNLGLIRTSLKSDALEVDGFQFQGVGTKEVSLIYLAGCVDRELLDKVRRALRNATAQELRDGQDLNRIFGFHRFHLLSPYHKTEIPIQAIASMMRGRVVLLIDGEPTAYVLPLLSCDFIMLEGDRQFPLFIMVVLRALRLLSILVALLMPGLYVALISVNPEMMRIELALSVATSRIGIPLPTFLEMLMLLLISEIIIEATQRLPRGIAATNTLIGGIILGQSIVEANLVSSLVLIVLSASVTANFAFPTYLNTLVIRLLRSGIVILSGIFGIMGLFAGFIAIGYYACSLERFGVPFMSFLSPKKLGQ
ncbi:spore gernimation protein GerA [Paenibacillus whitsoniae]|uniref:Spore gernimation protein GerA n=1 Tax=Paenibacillus whitsoniae TaxID=2496558 RepID=A0A3S0IAW1_9BACL|nr:spore gernimation protein GerA [Paenibacillus whitsoniae]